MSGSDSSARDAAAPEALSFTVHDLPAPDVAAQRKRVLSGRRSMVLIALACLAPVLASYFAYYVVRPGGGTNYATLISPTRTIPAHLALRQLDGTAVEPAALRDQWLLVSVGDAACDAGCERRLYAQRQLREMLGRERDRLDRVWLVTGEATVRPELLSAAEPTGGLTVLRADRAALAAWLAPGPGQALEDHLYVVDPMGEWMMRAPADLDPTRFKRDLDRLLRASASWDRPGR